jgi:hypothetical protein
MVTPDKTNRNRALIHLRINSAGCQDEGRCVLLFQHTQFQFDNPAERVGRQFNTMIICLLPQATSFACSRALEREGSKIDSNSAIIATTRLIGHSFTYVRVSLTRVK